MWTIITIIVGLWLVWTVVNYFYYRYTLKNSATVLESADFETQMHGQQIIDIREPKDFKAKHILGARNIHYPYLLQNASAIRKDKPVFLYDANAQVVARLAKKLKKQGYDKIFVLKGGIGSWEGKTKASEVR